MAYTIVVLIKQVPDMNAVRIDRGTGKPVFGGQNVISSFDEYAIEEALRLKEKHGGEVVVLIAGPASVKDAISRALAMGADRGVIIPLENPNALDSLGLSELIANQLKTLRFDIILTGQYSDDYASGQVGSQVAELLGIPQVGSITKVEANGETLTVGRDTEDGRQTIEVSTPVLLMAQVGLNEPRYPSLKGIMAAKKKPVEQAPAASIDGGGRLSWGEPFVPERGTTGTILQDVPAADAARQLVVWLREQKLI
ncbi:MAG: electron transfer flavoprotein beta subunit [Thermomicrobiales bacterium]|jgi:electron transfer flavoprotein beta subunit|nr:electron transfer flavoprotein beta subunit [Thermomicrobiales bacterium]